MPQTKKEQKEATAVRPPVIVIMGHIDHGKSSLLDYIRKSNVVAGEAGSITQHTSAYEVEHQTHDGKSMRITFLDTPGHEAFASMRTRGARVADIAVLVVSAEEGVKTQTLEALSAIKESGIPFIVAANKIDRPNANPEIVKQELSEHGVFVEGYGGTVSFVPISAKTGEGIPDLLDLMLLTAEMEELSGDPSKDAEGVVVESHRDPKKGVSATLIITDGTLKKGMYVAAEESLSPVRRIESHVGHALDEATFSSPVRIMGFDSIPPAGAIFRAFKNKKAAEAYIADLKTRADTPAP
jgi:translation initiation factor IF-2